MKARNGGRAALRRGPIQFRLAFGRCDRETWEAFGAGGFPCCPWGDFTHTADQIGARFTTAHAVKLAPTTFPVGSDARARHEAENKNPLTPPPPRIRSALGF